jgi:hypothetical protein
VAAFGLAVHGGQVRAALNPEAGGVHPVLDDVPGIGAGPDRLLPAHRALAQGPRGLLEPADVDAVGLIRLVCAAIRLSPSLALGRTL